VKSFAKSLFLAFMGTGLFFSFLMMITIPLMAMFSRLGDNVEKTSVVVSPAAFLRTYGVPAALVMFIVLFAIAFHRFRRDEQKALAALRH
jgi:hypothetical protein